MVFRDKGHLIFMPGHLRNAYLKGEHVLFFDMLQACFELHKNVYGIIGDFVYGQRFDPRRVRNI